MISWGYLDDFAFALVDGARSGDGLVVTLAVRVEKETSYIGCGLRFGASDDHGNTYWPSEARVTATVGAFGPLPGFKLAHQSTFLRTVKIPKIPDAARLNAILVGSACSLSRVAALPLDAGASWPIATPLRQMISAAPVLPDWISSDVSSIGEWLAIDQYFSFKVDKVIWDDGWLDIEVTFKNEDYQSRPIPRGQLAALSANGYLTVTYDPQTRVPGYSAWATRGGLPMVPSEVGALSELQAVISTYSGSSRPPRDGLGLLVSLDFGRSRDREQTYAFYIAADRMAEQAATSVKLERGTRVRVRATDGCVVARAAERVLNVSGSWFITECLPPGALGVIEDGPRLDSERHDWWKLRGREWVQGYWLRGDWR